MGNAKLWYHPKSGGLVAEVDVGGPLSSLDDWAAPVPIGDETADGREFSITTITPTLVQLTIEKFDDAVLYRRLKVLEGWLQRGGTCALADDAAKAVAGYLVTSPARGDTALTLGAQPWSTYNPSAALAADDEIVLETGQPVVRRELTKLSAVSGSSLTISPGAILDYVDEPWVLARYRGFFPSLRLPRGSRSRQLLTTERRVVHTFSATLEVVPYAYGVFAGIGSETIIGSSYTDGDRTPDEILIGSLGGP